MKSNTRRQHTLKQLAKRVKVLESNLREVTRTANISFDLARRACRAWELQDVLLQMPRVHTKVRASKKRT